MNEKKSSANELENIFRAFHLGLTVFGISAWATGFLADDCKRMEHLGFSIHSWLGIIFAFFLFLRIGYGFIGPDDHQFIRWVPFTKDKLRLVFEDLWTLIKFKLPDRPTHVGLSGLVQTFGLAAFAWMAVTGSLMFFYLTPGTKAKGFLHPIKPYQRDARGRRVVYSCLSGHTCRRSPAPCPGRGPSLAADVLSQRIVITKPLAGLSIIINPKLKLQRDKEDIMRKVAIFILIGILLSVGFAFAQKKFYGIVQSMPEQGYVGLWIIDGKTVNVTKDTKIKEKHGKLAVGAYVEVEGVTFEGKFIASELETEKKK